MKTLCQNRETLFLFLACVILLSLAGFTACAEPTPTPPLVEEWSADGIIKAREYHGSNIYGDYEIYWLNDEQYVYIAMKAKTSGWVSMAIQPGSKMKDADVVIGFIKDGEATLYDFFSTGNYGPHSPDTQLGGTDNIIEFGGKEESGFTTMEFKRALNTGDNYDIPLASGVNKIIWAYSSSDSLKTKHSKRGYGEINL